MLTRIAPTPSGFLHEGNLVNILLIDRLALAVGAEIALRIDDMDAFRLRPEYVEDIFRCLEWLGIRWSQGPRGFADYQAIAPAEERAEHYFQQLESLIAAGLPAFVCACSRRDLGRDARCERGCEDRRLKLAEGKTAVRIRVPDSEPDLRAAMGDFVIWRREDLPAYQLQSVLDDEELGVTHIVRGADLRDSTLAQRYLANFLPDSSFLRADIRHHPLVAAANGDKLSKSQGTERLELSVELRTRLDALADSLGPSIGL